MNQTLFQHFKIAGSRTVFSLGALACFAGSAAGQCEEQRINSLLGNPIDVFGWSVAMNGGWAAVSTIGDDYFCPTNPNCNAGAVQMYRTFGGNWATDGHMRALDWAPGDEFGQDIDIGPSRVIVGAHMKDTGAAYVFEREATGWVQKQKLVPAGAVTGDHVGHSVGMAGHFTSFVGAMRDGHAGPESGAVYVYEFLSSTWQEGRKITASNAAPGDRFGREIAVAEDMLVVGAVHHNHVGPDSGAAYVFQRVNSGTPGPLDDTWPETQILHNSNGSAGDRFGRSLAMDGDTLVIGADQGTVNGVDQGYVTVYEFQDPLWVEVQTLTASDGEADDRFGRSVSVHGDDLLIGASGDDDNGPQAGAVYLFQRSGGGPWVEMSKLLASDGSAGASMGDEMGVAVSFGRAVVGARFHSPGVNLLGSAYFYNLGDCLWTNFCTAQPNTTGQASYLEAMGSTLLVANDFTLKASDLPLDQFAIFLAGTATGFTANPGGSLGDLCLGGSIGRFNAAGEIRYTGTTGKIMLSLDLHNIPSPTGPVMTFQGQTWHFQAWYRDFVPGTGSVSNFTDGMTVTFL